MKGQSEFARAYRLKRGGCPTHGTEIQPSHFLAEEDKGVFVCPRKDCPFTIEVRVGDALWRTLFSSTS